MKIYIFEIKRNLKKTIILFATIVIMLVISLTNNLNSAEYTGNIDELPVFLRGLLTGLDFDTTTYSGSFLFINGFVMLIISFKTLSYGTKLGQETASKYDILYLKAPREQILSQKTLAHITLLSILIFAYTLTATLIFISLGEAFAFLLISGLMMVITSIFLLLLVNTLSLFIKNTKVLNMLLPLFILSLFGFFFIGSTFDIQFLSIISLIHYSTNHNIVYNRINFLFLVFAISTSTFMYFLINKKYKELDVTN